MFPRIHWFAVIPLCLWLAGCDNDGLTVRQTAGGTATIVTVTGPRNLLQRVAEVARLREECVIPPMWAAHGFFIDWGDDDRYGTRADAQVLGPDGCEDWLKHRYTVPGTYQIHAGIYHLGPTDMPMRDWESTVAVTVEGERQALDFQLTEPSSGEAYAYRPRINAAWSLSTDAPVDLAFDLVGENGEVAKLRRFARLSYVGRGATALDPWDKDYQHLVRFGPICARLRATVSFRGTVLLVRESSPFILTNEEVGMHSYMPQAELVPDQVRTVVLRHYTATPRCHGYIIDWGDGTPPARESTELQTRCLTESTWITTTHAYATAGHFRITVRTNDHTFSQPPEASPLNRSAMIPQNSDHAVWVC